MSLETLLQRVIRPEVQRLKAYHVADARGLIKLDAMENPYAWPEAAIAGLLETLKNSAMNRYPDPEARTLQQALRDSQGIASQHGLLLGNGSDEIIAMLMMALPSKACVLAPEPTFVMYRQIAGTLGLDFQGIPLLADSFALDMNALCQIIEDKQPALIFLAYPNNPTGNLFAESDINAVLVRAPGLVVVDEAYAPFTEASYLPMLGEHDNLLVMRTLSKLGLAGLRLGYLAGHPALIEQLNKIRLPYNINVLTQIAAEFALTEGDFLTQQTQTLTEQRGVLQAGLHTLPMLTVYPSEANFIMFKAPDNQADIIHQSLKDAGILIKNLSPQGGLLQDCLRVTVGTPTENQAFLKALNQCLMA
ncbi:MAG: histidinol-phosphate transaminase [Methylococcales bacterium]|nr:histidinol-phosphate transaminase [Methylococcales bacterium]